MWQEASSFEWGRTPRTDHTASWGRCWTLWRASETFGGRTTSPSGPERHWLRGKRAGGSKYLYGEYSPKREFIKAFTDAFELTSYERAELAWLYTYGSRSDAADSRRLASSGPFVSRGL